MKKNHLIIGAAVLAALFLLKNKAGATTKGAVQAMSPAGMKAAPIKANELVSAKSFARLATKRQGYIYVPAKLTQTGLIEFKSPRPGLFTRYVVQSGGQILAEVKA